MVKKKKRTSPSIAEPVINISRVYKLVAEVVPCPLKVWLSGASSVSLLAFLCSKFVADSKHVWIFIAEESLKEIYFLGKSFLFFGAFIFRPVEGL